MRKTTLLATLVLTVATFMTTGLVIMPGPVQGSDVSTDTDNPCAGNVITQSTELPTTDDSEEVDSDIECEFYGPGDIEGGGQQVPPDTDDASAP